MAILIKAMFFILFGINSLLALFTIFSFFDLVTDPYKKNSEGFVLLAGGCILAVGLYMSYQYGYLLSDFMKGLIILAVALIVAIIWVIIGLLFFSGPLHWQ